MIALQLIVGKQIEIIIKLYRYEIQCTEQDALQLCFVSE